MGDVCLHVRLHSLHLGFSSQESSRLGVHLLAHLLGCWRWPKLCHAVCVFACEYHVCCVRSRVLAYRNSSATSAHADHATSGIRRRTEVTLGLLGVRHGLSQRRVCRRETPDVDQRRRTRRKGGSAVVAWVDGTKPTCAMGICGCVVARVVTVPKVRLISTTPIQTLPNWRPLTTYLKSRKHTQKRATKERRRRPVVSRFPPSFFQSFGRVYRQSSGLFTS